MPGLPGRDIPEYEGIDLGALNVGPRFIEDMPPR
jgi:hypothetical protein